MGAAFHLSTPVTYILSLPHPFGTAIKEKLKMHFPPSDLEEAFGNDTRRLPANISLFLSKEKQNDSHGKMFQLMVSSSGSCRPAGTEEISWSYEVSGWRHMRRTLSTYISALSTVSRVKFGVICDCCNHLSALIQSDLNHFPKETAWDIMVSNCKSPSKLHNSDSEAVFAHDAEAYTYDDEVIKKTRARRQRRLVSITAKEDSLIFTNEFTWAVPKIDEHHLVIRYFGLKWVVLPELSLLEDKQNLGGRIVMSPPCQWFNSIITI